ncbi:nicotinate-nucleotide--dimethylbenzimidazole phosphoribosyltransferase [Haloplanus natans]|uniref:nicotinate-nucleotide--dimethylbenzimidazole phosphoribosyltransferase n=1 Tax=Haloplanus natans TaxID=376171 RepID=UPI000677B482|nr:nicotinate-nucleotide--dimethylbenzimidazole phosphoribosyltransferase [Haloplanus natans]
MTRFVLVAGTTETARIEGISAAGADPALVAHTPSADAELIEYGHLVRAPAVPVSPTGCPTPAAVTRAVREQVGFETLVVDAGLAEPTGAPTVDVGAKPGRDVREADPVPTAPGAWVAARELGHALPDDELVIGETIPGGTTTALGVCRALGVGEAPRAPREDGDAVTVPVSSSLPENPRDLKRRVVDDGFAASDLDPGDAAYRPKLAVRFLGDPTLAVVAGLVAGALESGTDVVLGGGTQMLAAAALVRHAGVADPLTVATTTYVAAETDLRAAAAGLDCELVVTDPGFAGRDDPLARYAAGEAKEGAGMGGALYLADRSGSLGAVADGTLEVVERVNDSYGP